MKLFNYSSRTIYDTETGELRNFEEFEDNQGLLQIEKMLESYRNGRENE